MTQLDLEYRAIIESLDGDVSSRKLARTFMDSSTAVYHGNCIDTLYSPKLWDAKTITALRDAAETMHRILSKMIEHYVADASYRPLFGFTPELERLICLPTGYPQPLPMGRIDIFLDEDTLDFKLCEFNGDGSSGMNEDRELCSALALTSTYQKMAQSHHLAPFSLFDSWVEAFGRIYATYEHAVKAPHVAIVDFLDITTLQELEIFRRRFAKAGYDCRVIEASDLRFDGHQLSAPDGWRVDAIYRRAVLSEILTRRASVEDLIAAAEANAVCLIGGFRTQVAHCKNAFEVLHMPQTAAFLSPAEQTWVAAHVPYTTQLDTWSDTTRPAFAPPLSEKDRWIVKPSNSYGGDDVTAGAAVDDATWRQTIESRTGKGYVLQEYCLPCQSENLRQGRGHAPLSSHWEQFNNMTGLYLYDGRFAGTFSRAGQKATISDAVGGTTVASITVDCTEDELHLREGLVL
jgi:hypothetical protein